MSGSGYGIALCCVVSPVTVELMDAGFQVISVIILLNRFGSKQPWGSTGESKLVQKQRIDFPPKWEVIIMRKLAKLFTRQSRQIASNSAFMCFPFIQRSGPNGAVQSVPDRRINTCSWPGRRSPVCETSDGTPKLPWGWP